MAKTKRDDPPIHQLTVRISRATAHKLEAFSGVTGRPYVHLVEAAINVYLDGLNLTDDEKREIKRRVKALSE